MEDALVHPFLSGGNGICYVLILVLMEDALVLEENIKSGKKTMMS